MKKKIIVVGAGIIGASIAYHLAKAGAEVLVIEAGTAAGGLATSNSFAWINASWGNPPEYIKLRMRSMMEWRKLESVHPDLAVNWCGGLSWDLPEAELREFCSQREAMGYGTRLVGHAQMHELEPTLKQPPELGVCVAGEGAIEPIAAARGFMAAAQVLGAKLVAQTEVLRLIVLGSKITGVETPVDNFVADEVVVAAGAQSRSLLQFCGIKLAIDAPAGLLVHSKSVPKILNGLVMAPHLHVRQTVEGRLVAGSDYGGAQPGDNPEQAAENLFIKLREFFVEGDKLEMDFYTLGFRPTPADGFPVIGRPTGYEGLYVAALHSGITLAPVVGSFSSDEILYDRRDELLVPYHPDRLIA